MNGMEVLEIKEEEVAEQKYIYSAKEIWELSNSSKRTWDNFVSGFLSVVNDTQKTDYLEEHPSRSGGNRYTEKTLKAFQAWLLRNQANQGRASDTIKSIVKTAVKNEGGDWYSVKEICDICNTSRQTWTVFKNEFNCKINLTVKKNLREDDKNVDYYPENILKAFQAWLMKNQANQGRASDTIKEATTQAVEKDLVITEVIRSGNQEAFDQLMKQYKLAFDIAQENKRLLEQTKQMEHALNYTAVIGWKRWSDLKKELAQNFEIFKHRISFKTVAAEAGLVKETDYAERIYGEDCFPTTMISESGIDKIYNCYDR